MSLDGLQLDADGYVDMDQFPDDGTDLGEADLASLRDTLHSDPVEEPTDAEWDAMFDEVLAADDSGPFAVDGGDVPTADDTDTGDLFGAEAGEAAAEMSADDADLADDDAGSDDAAADLDLDAQEDLAFDDVATDDVPSDLDLDGGLDLSADGGLDDGFASDAVDEVPADIANNDFEDLI